MKFIKLIDIKMPSIVGILAFNGRMNTIAKSIKVRNFYIVKYFSFYEQLNSYAQLS